jgi:hypothetical protein
MPNDPPRVPAPPEAKVATVDDHPLAVLESKTPVLVDPDTLIQALRYLQQCIPEFTQLSVREERSMMRAAHLDPGFIDIGIQTAEAWNEPADVLGFTGPELRREVADVRKWDEVERELRALTQGVAAANLRRKHRVGKAVLFLYHLLRDGSRPHLRPYLDDMRRAYNRTRKKPRKTSPQTDAAETTK